MSMSTEQHSNRMLEDDEVKDENSRKNTYLFHGNHFDGYDVHAIDRI